METPSKKPRNTKLAILVVTVLIVSILTAGFAGYYIGHPTTSSSQQNQDTSNSNQADTSDSSASNTSNQSVAVDSTDNNSLSEIYQQVASSVVVIEDFQLESNVFNQASYSQVQGSGFIYDLNGQDVVVTNYHVVDGGVNVTVTFQDGNTYTAKVLGSDIYSDLAILSTDAPQSELVPLTIVNSSSLKVGDETIAIGSPYGLTGSMTTGIVSALNRTITEDTGNEYAISDIIQTSTAINSGNSGGPLLNYNGQVIGITTAIVTSSQGLGFAVPSDTILREINALATNGTYNAHPYLGIGGADMTYDIAKQMGTEVTYGVLIEQVTSKGPADKAGIIAGTHQIIVDSTTVYTGGDIIVGINGSRIRNMDDLSSYLEEYTLPGQTVSLTVIRSSQTLSISLSLGTRPAATSTGAS